MSARPASAVEEASRSKTPVPSGRLLLRMPPSLHAALARAAEREGSSLNGYIINRLTATVEWSPDELEVNGHERERLRASQRRVMLLLAANVGAVTLAALAAVAILLVAWLS